MPFRREHDLQGDRQGADSPSRIKARSRFQFRASSNPCPAINVESFRRVTRSALSGPSNDAVHNRTAPFHNPGLIGVFLDVTGA
ncbi:hypothetical protein CEXT_247771 [Caerostris extrusa]|uniref:Uncharacterized protein n=1 Tax=Caerostris extrusa TaxID=172846 RepID=A0AAV4MNW4_CAEEX|nr:hypothetical protein CEXT_247771 [Caerostris extrusa]